MAEAAIRSAAQFPREEERTDVEDPTDYARMSDPLFNAEPARKMWRDNATLMHLLLASGVLLWAALENAPGRYVWFGEGRDGLLTYAVVVAAASLAACTALVLILTVVGDVGFRKTLFSLPRLGDVNVGVLIAAIFAIWWCAAAGVLTFSLPQRIAPYGSLSNAYGALWLGAICSIGMVGKACGHALGHTPVLGNLACSIVVLVAALLLDDPGRPVIAWSIILGASSCTLHAVLLLFGPEALGSAVVKLIAVCLLLLWIPGAAVLTFKGPFTSANHSANGFFAAWLGLFTAAMFVSDRA